MRQDLFSEDMALLQGSHLTAKNKAGQDVHVCKNDVPHTVKLILCDPDGD